MIIFDNFIIEIIGKRRAISTSKIKKITAIKKNCKLNGRRADLFGSNPHSNGEFFSRSIKVFLDNNLANVIVIIAINIIIIEITDVIMIIYTKKI